MANEVQKLSGAYRRTGRETYSSMIRSAGAFRNNLQGMSRAMAEFSESSVNQAIDVQSELTKKAFSVFISELSKLATMGLYAPMFGRDEGRQEHGERTTAQEAGRRTGQARTGKPNKSRNGASRSGQRTAAQRATTQRKTGPAKRSRKAKRK
jgi:hypothetical protein